MKKIYILGGLIVLVIFGALVYLSQPKEQEVSSVQRASEYHSANLFATSSAYYLIKSGNGTFCSAVINVLGTGNVVFYDATTTNVNLRVNQQATSSLPVVAVISNSQAAGTYTYDNLFYNGLLAVFQGTQGSSTITFR